MKRRDFLEGLTKTTASLFAASQSAALLATLIDEKEAAAQIVPTVAMRNRRPVLGAYGSNIVASEDGITMTSLGSFLPVKATTGNYFGIAYLGGTYCLTTDYIGALTTTDLTTWTLGTLPIGGSSIASNGSVFLICDRASNATATSVDGISWTTRTSPLPLTTDFVWTGTQFFAFSDTQGATSPDGITWTLRTLPAPLDHYISVAWNGSKLCLLDYYGSAATSTDGITWTTSGFDTSTVYLQICAYGTRFAAHSLTGQIATSADGVTWSLTTPSSGVTNVGGGTGTLLLGISFNNISTSSDATTFTTRSTAAGFWQHSVTANSITFVLGYGVSALLTSTNLTSWTSHSLPLVYSVPTNPNLARSNSTLLAVPVGLATQTTLTSTNRGVTWSANYTALPSVTKWGGLAYGSTSFVLLVSGTSTTAAYSTDGVSWSSATMPASRSWTAVAWNGTVFCAVSTGSTSSAVSSNGSSWSSGTLPSSASWSMIAANRGTFVAFATGTTAAYSSNGTSWTPVTLPTTDTWQAIVWNGKYFCALGYSGIVLTSPTGAVWTQQTTLTGGGYKSLIYNGAYLIAWNGGNAVATSNDGITWITGSVAAFGSPNTATLR